MLCECHVSIKYFDDLLRFMHTNHDGIQVDLI